VRNAVSVELDEIRGSRVREHERDNKSGRGSSYRRGSAIFAEIAAAAVRHSARHDRYVQFRHPRQTERECHLG